MAISRIDPDGEEKPMRRNWPWWTVGAAVLAASLLILAIGNLVSHDEGAYSSKVLVLAGAALAATLVFGGLALRRRGRAIGSAAVAVGCLPGCAALVLWWFPPAVGAGFLSLAITVFAAADAARSHQP